MVRFTVFLDIHFLVTNYGIDKAEWGGGSHVDFCDVRGSHIDNLGLNRGVVYGIAHLQKI